VVVFVIKILKMEKIGTEETKTKKRDWGMSMNFEFLKT
jgi:hypothetical protein